MSNNDGYSGGAEEYEQPAADSQWGQYDESYYNSDGYQQGTDYYGNAESGDYYGDYTQQHQQYGDYSNTDASGTQGDAGGSNQYQYDEYDPTAYDYGAQQLGSQYDDNSFPTYSQGEVNDDASYSDPTSTALPSLDTSSAIADSNATASNAVSAFGNAAAYATPRPKTPPPHWREKEMTKRVYDRVNKRRIGGILATAGMKQLRNEVLEYEKRTSTDHDILKSKQTVALKKSIDASRFAVVDQQHASELLMRSVETQQDIASRFKVNQDIARQDLLKQLPTLSSVQERVHRLRTLYTREAAKASEAAKKFQNRGRAIVHQPPVAKPVVAARLRVKEELKALAPMPVNEMFKHLKTADALEQMLRDKRRETTSAASAAVTIKTAGLGPRPKTVGDDQDEHKEVDLNDPYEINRLLYETKLADLLKEKSRSEALESGIDPDTGCIPPQCPLNVRATAVSASTIQLTWDPPIFDGGQPIMDYVVYFVPCTLEKIGKRTKRTFGAEEHFFTTRWYKPNPIAHNGFTWTFRRAETTFARVYVRAVNVVGQGSASNVVQEVTMPFADNPSRPTNVCVDKVTTRSIYLRWQPPLDDGGAPIIRYHITYTYQTWRDIKGPLKGGAGGRITATAHIEVEDPNCHRYKISNLAGDTKYNHLCVQAANSHGRISKRSTPIEGVRTLKCNDLQTCQNEIERIRSLKHEYCDTDVLTRGHVIQRVRCADLLVTLQEKFDDLQLQGLELDPPSDDEEWLAAGRTGEQKSENGESSPIVSRVVAAPKVYPKVKVKLFLPKDGKVGDEMIATAPSGWVSHIRVPQGAQPGEFFEVEIENRPMRRKLVVRLEHFKKKISKLQNEIVKLTNQCEEWAAKKNFNSYRLSKLEQRLRTFAAEADRLNMHDGVYVDSIIMHGSGTSQRFKTAELKEMLANEMHAIKLGIAEFKKEMVLIEDGFHQAERRRKFLEECLNDRYAGELAAKRENKRKFRIKTILGHASHWFLGRAMNNWCQYVIIRREEKRRMKSIIFAMTHGKLRSAINKWKRTIRELDKLEEISDELWGKGSRALVRVNMLRRDLEGNLQLVLSKVREQSTHLDKYMSFTEKQIKSEFESVHFRRKQRLKASSKNKELKSREKMSAAEKLQAKVRDQRIAASRKLALASLSQGDVSMSNKKYAPAFESYMRYLDYCRNGEPDNIDAAGMGVAYGRIGQVFEIWGEENKALVCYLRSEGLGKEVDDIEMQAQALYYIGNIYFKQLKYPDAVSKLGNAFDFFTELKNEVWKAKTLRALAKPYEAMFDETKAKALHAAAEKIENVLQNQLTEIKEKLTDMHNTITDTVPIHCTIVPIETCTSTYPRLRQRRQELLWDIEDVDRKMNDILKRRDDAEELVKRLKELKKDAKAAPWADMSADLGHGQVETFKAKDFGWKVSKAIDDAKAKRKQARDAVQIYTTRKRNWEDEVQELDRDIAVENGVLMKKVIAEKRMRCVALNDANVRRNDVIGFAVGGVEKMAMAIENNVVVVDLFSGEATIYFIGDEEGSHATEMKGHTKQVTCLQFYAECVYSGSVDHTIRVWDINKRVCKATLKGHRSTVWSIAVDVEKIVSGAADNDMRIWDAETFECLKVIHGHKRTVRHIFLDGMMFSTTSTDETIAVWRIVSKGNRKFKRVDRLCKLRGHRCTVNVARFRSSDLVSGGADGRIFTWDLKTEKALRQIKAHEGSVRDLQFDGTRIISCGADSLVLIHDYATGDRLHVLRGHGAAVLALQFDTSRMITVSADQTMRHWHFKRPTTKEMTLTKHHAFEEGETLAEVARRYGLSIHKLCADNNIDENASNGNDIYPGRLLLVRTMQNDFQEPKILQKTSDKYTTGLVKRMMLEVQKATDLAERTKNKVAIGSDEVQDSTLSERRKERVRLQLMERKAQREVMMEERRQRKIIEEKGPQWESESSDDDDFTGEVQ